MRNVDQIGPSQGQSAMTHRNDATPLVSIIIPCFNAASTVARTIASARQQTYPAIEIIAVDDCSNDGTLEILRNEEGEGVRIVARERNGGAAAARNDAIAIARGEFLAFIDADDEWHPDKLRRQIEVIGSRNELAMIGCRAEECRLDGSRAPVNPSRHPPIGIEAWRMMLRENFFVPSVVMARSDVVRHIGGFNETLRSAEEDQDFFIRMALAGEVGFLDEVLTVMHEQPVSFSRQFLSLEDKTTLPMILRHCELLRKRLTRSELRRIMGARYTQVGRNVYLSRPASGARLLIRAILLGGEPLVNLWYLVTASPWVRWIKLHVLRRAIKGSRLRNRPGRCL